MKTIILNIGLVFITLISNAQQTSSFDEKFSLNELIDIADHRVDILEYGSKKIDEKGYELRRTISDKELGTRLTFLYWASKVELQRSKYFVDNGPDFEILYNIEFGDSTFNQIEIDHFNLIARDVKTEGYREINHKEMVDGSVIQLFQKANKKYYIMLINSPYTKYLYIGNLLKFRFDNSLFNECCDPLIGCQ